MSYISELQIDSGAILPVGSSLYGTCNTPVGTYAKEVILTNFDTLVHGVTIHVKFTYGNNATLTNPADSTEHLTLKVGTTNAQLISNPGGSINWSAGAVISFTYDDIAHNWIVNDSDNGTSITIANTYSSTSEDAISGKGVADAFSDMGLDNLGAAAQKGIITNIVETGAGANKTSTDLPTTNAITSYVDSKTAGITGAMHFVGRTTTTMTDDMTTAEVIINGSSYIPNPGDVVLSGDHQEYVWVETNISNHTGYWELLGDEGSYLYVNSVENTSVINGITFSAGTLPSVTLDASSTSVLTGMSNASGDNAARVTSAEVTGGVLHITTGILPQFNTGSVHGVASVSNGTAPSLTPSTISVLKTREN